MQVPPLIVVLALKVISIFVHLCVCACMHVPVCTSCVEIQEQPTGVSSLVSTLTHQAILQVWFWLSTKYQYHKINNVRKPN